MQKRKAKQKRIMPKAKLIDNSASGSQTTFYDLDDDCLALILGDLTALDRLRLESVCRRFQKCMYHVVDVLSIIFFPIIQLYSNGETIWETFGYNCFLEFQNKLVDRNQFLKPWQFWTLVSKINGRVMQLSVSFVSVEAEMLKCIKVLNYRSLEVIVGDLTVIETDLLFGKLGDKIKKLEIDDWCNQTFGFRAKWALQWFQTGVFQRLEYISLSHRELSEHFDAFAQAWQTKLPSHVRFNLRFDCEENLVKRAGPWLRQRIDDLTLYENLFEDAFDEPATFTNLRKLCCCVLNTHFRSEL